MGRDNAIEKTKQQKAQRQNRKMKTNRKDTRGRGPVSRQTKKPL